MKLITWCATGAAVALVPAAAALAGTPTLTQSAPAHSVQRSTPAAVAPVAVKIRTSTPKSTHDAGDDHGRHHARGVDDGPNHDLGDDHGRHRDRGADDGHHHDSGDDHGGNGRHGGHGGHGGHGDHGGHGSDD